MSDDLGNKSKKSYSFGEYEILSFEDILKDMSDDLKMLDVYAFIPIADCSDSMPADFCMAPP